MASRSSFPDRDESNSEELSNEQRSTASGSRHSLKGSTLQKEPKLPHELRYEYPTTPNSSLELVDLVVNNVVQLRVESSRHALLASELVEA